MCVLRSNHRWLDGSVFFFHFISTESGCRTLSRKTCTNDRESHSPKNRRKKKQISNFHTIFVVVFFVHLHELAQAHTHKQRFSQNASVIHFTVYFFSFFGETIFSLACLLAALRSWNHSKEKLSTVIADASTFNFFVYYFVFFFGNLDRWLFDLQPNEFSLCDNT